MINKFAKKTGIYILFAAVFGILSLAAAAGSAHASIPTGLPGKGPAQAVKPQSGINSTNVTGPAVACVVAWNIQSTHNIGTWNTYLTAITTVSTNDVWAVGFSTGNSLPDQNLIEHWDGTKWSVVASPNVGTTSNALVAVSAVSSSDIWAAGYYQGANGHVPTTLHWNGSAWSAVNVFLPAAAYWGELHGITMLSSNDGWAVGEWFDGNVHSYTLHWDGNFWNNVTAVDPYGSAYLQAVSASSSNDVWAGGYFYQNSYYFDYAIHWNGSQWTLVSPNDGGNSAIQGIKAIAPNNVWAVGTGPDNYWPYHEKSLILHWDGTRWSRIYVPNYQDRNYLLGISGPAANDLWVVGYNVNDMNGNAQAMAFHYDGSGWSPVTIGSHGPGESAYAAVAALPGGDVWTAGNYHPFSGAAANTLTDHYDGAQFSEVISVTPNTGVQTLNGAAARGPNDVWAVGSYTDQSVNLNRALAEHWDGAQWSTSAARNNSTYTNVLNAVTVAPGSSGGAGVFAAGYYTTTNNTKQTLVEYFDGANWNLYNSPSVGLGSNTLSGISASSSSDVWAVGTYRSGGQDYALAIHYNGSYFDYTTVNDNILGHFNSVVDIEPNDVWAAGSVFNGDANQPLLAHWNGSAWTVIDNPPTYDPFVNHEIRGMVAFASNNIWAVGSYNLTSSRTQTLILHYDGTTWSIVSSPNATTTSNDLNSISGGNPNDIWAVGSYRTATSPLRLTLAMHWNGTAWTIVSSPNASAASSVLAGVAYGGPNDVYAVGFGNSLTLAEAYRQPCPPTPTPTSTFTNTSTPTITNTPTLTPTSTNTPSPTLTPCTVATPMNEAFEGSTLGAFVSTGGPGWGLSSPGHAGNNSAFAPDPSFIADQRLTLATPVSIPANATSAQLTFYHKFIFDNGNFTIGADGGVMEFSTDNGANWFDASANFLYPYYNGTITNSGGQPLADRRGWLNSNGAYTPVTVNLMPYAGQNLLFRFRMGTNSSNAGTGQGWWIDDVQVLLGLPCAPATNTPTSTFTATNTATNTPTNTITSTPTNTPAATFTATSTLTNTPAATSTATRTNTGTATVTNTATNTPSYTATATNTAVPTNTLTATATSTNTAASTATSTRTSTSTSTATPTGTSTSTRTATPSSTTTNTLTPASTSTVTNTPTMTATPASCGPTGDYAISQSAGSVIVPGTVLVQGSQGDNVVAPIRLPFTYNFYGIQFANVNVSSNGNLQFDTNSTESHNTCYPYDVFGSAVAAYWADLTTDSFACVNCGIYTSVSGVSPNQIFNIEWRACPAGASNCRGTINFEVRLYEGQNRLDIVYGNVLGGGASAVVGVQNGVRQQYTEYSCNTASLQTGLQITFYQPDCSAATPTATSTYTPVSTFTATSTATSSPVPTETTSPVLVGHVTWQGRPAQPNAGQQLPITLTLKLGTTETNYPVQTTDARGYFTVALGTLAPGTYNWRVKGPKYLANTGNLALTGAATTNTEMGLMRVGDANGDNLVNAQDFNILKVTFGKGNGDPGYDARADFTGDNLVNVTDFNLLKGNFGFAGGQPLSPQK